MNSSSNNSSDFSNGVANNTSSPAPITEPEHGGGSSNLLIGFLLVAATGVVLCGLVVFYIQRKKRERLRLAFKPIYNTEGDDDWDINVDPTVQVKDTARLTPTKQHKMPFSSTATDLNNSHQQQPSKTRSIGGKSGGGPAQINNRATLQFNLNGADTEDVPHPEVTQPPQTKFTTT